MTIKTVLIAGAVTLLPLAAQAEWQENIQIDRITGETLSAGIESAAFADEPRPYPFSLVPGWLYLSCRGGVLFAFNDRNMVGVILESAIEFSDLDELPIRARVDDRVAEFRAENWRDES